jgi:hypothetical protein
VLLLEATLDSMPDDDETLLHRPNGMAARESSRLFNRSVYAPRLASENPLRAALAFCLSSVLNFSVKKTLELKLTNVFENT